ncbi:hypothetical protein [Blastopirellula marina]|uniref:Uncharacterized protein n=1 Tax=Blastopirellula marina TaxID=124 RepID=A0A2S8G8R8_9BACT|nr:hypothetical protein [Blastopirellula marina]PQO40700.1 hypothetical protein C5Y98_05635 [Blastopirellula marina]PTL45660.1 hypothetical protein C5Y97_05635 [Blastopirellula marina]
MTHPQRVWIASILLTLSLSVASQAAENDPPRQISGIYPHLAYWNDHGECGTGAVVPWTDKLWVITYGPHFPHGSTDKLYSIDHHLAITPFADSVGGTPANRMIHRETNQLLIGPYVVSSEGNVRVIPPKAMPGRLTGNARHLFDPAHKAYYATMEEGFYEVDLNSLEVTTLFQDSQGQLRGKKPDEGTAPLANLPGYHGKGLYSGQGRLIYANNGDNAREALVRPDVPSGCLAEWDGKSETWTVIRRNQFCDVRGPGDLLGNPNPATDPIWAIGWDHRSLILMLLDEGKWTSYRLPKASHCYDGAHGWNTEWPRIHDIGLTDFNMTMHGMFWHFPPTFTKGNSAGIAPRSTYLKVIGDYCRWNDQLVFGCDDAAQSEFLNKRKAKGEVAGPGQSHSNLWFTSPEILDKLGPSIGRGAVWLNDKVAANTPSEPYLFAGFQQRNVCLTHAAKVPVTFTFEVDRQGNDQWTPLAEITVPPGQAVWHSFAASEEGAWIRVAIDQACEEVTAQFQYSSRDPRGLDPANMFQGIRTSKSQNYSQGIVRVRGDKLQTLAFSATQVEDGQVVHEGFYELDGNLRLTDQHDVAAFKWTNEHAAIPQGVLTHDTASILYIDDDGNRWRLPRSPGEAEAVEKFGPLRVSREVATERDLFNCGGTFYELPARNAGGMAKVRPIASHPYAIHDYCSYRGLMIVSGIDAEAKGEHILRSDDGRVALWAGVIDDLWKLGKPVGIGGPWKETAVEGGAPSDPYLMTGFDAKRLTLLSDVATKIKIEVDITGTGNWQTYETVDLNPNQPEKITFPADFQAYWIRFTSTQPGKMTGQLEYK